MKPPLAKQSVLAPPQVKAETAHPAPQERLRAPMNEEVLFQRYLGNSYTSRHFETSAPTGELSIHRVARQLQRCACGKSSQEEGECSACRSKRLAFLRDQAHPAPTISNPISEALVSVPMTTPQDASELEAERLAAQIAHMPTPRVSMRRQPSIQRRLSTSDFAPGVQQALHLTGAGSALPASVRTYMEPRFGADLGDVRVHTGTQAETLTAGLNAEAFTYGHHIWLGNAQATTDTQLMAHELTHVIQQTPQLTESEAPPVPERRIQRKVDYYSLSPLPGHGSSGTRTHDKLKAALGQESANANLMFEINVPGGNTAGVGIGQLGRPDLFLTSPQPHTLGVTFSGNPPTPEYLAAHQSARRGNTELSQREHQQLAAPVGTRGAPIRARVRPPGFTADPGITRMNDAPTTIKVGDIKSKNDADRFLGNYNQLGNYISGINQTIAGVNAFNAANPTSFSPAASPTWVATVQRMDSNDITIPAPHNPDTYPSTTGGPARVVGYSATGKRQPYTETDAFLYLIFDRANPGIWFYEYVPVTGPSASSVGAATQAQRQVNNQLQTQVIRPVNTAPTRQKSGARRLRSGTPAQTIRPAQRQKERRIQRQATETFDLQQWRTTHFLPWRTQARTYLGSPEARTIDQVDVLRRIRERTGISRIVVAGDARELGRDIRHIERWEEHGELFGRLRKTFGGLYVRVIAFYEKVRARFHELTKKRQQRGNVGSGALGTITRLAFTILQRFAGVIVGRVADRLMDAFHTGMTDYLSSVVSDEVDEVRHTIEAVTQRVRDMEQAVQAEYDRIVEELLSPYEEQIRQIEDIRRIIGDVSTIINAARIALCVASCGLPPGLGCIWGCVGQLVGEVVFNELVKSCWFQREFLFPIINGSDFISQLPDVIARMIHSRLVQAMPIGLRPLLGTIATLPSSRLSASDLDCDASQPAPDVSMRSSLETLSARHGAERVGALIGLLIHLGAARPGGTMSAELIDALNRFLSQNSAVTAADLNRLRRELPGRFPGTSTLEAELNFIQDRVRATPGNRTTPGNRATPSQERGTTPRVDIFQRSLPQPRTSSGNGVTVFEF